MATASDILRIARAEIGTKESPANSNKVKYNTWYYGREVSGSAYPWCMVFVQWVFAKAGVAVPVKTASCGALLTAAKSKEQAVYSGYKPGDVVIYDFDGNGSTDHCGIVEKVSGSTIVAIEGNTGSGSDADGGQVQRRTRKTSTIVGAWRPAYKEDEAVEYAEWKKFMEQYRKELAGKSVDGSLKAELDEAVKAGITDGKRPCDFATRAEVSAMVTRAKK